ncbi:MAG: hypothetical protein WB809_00775 [Thermoplasmata archaeon]
MTAQTYAIAISLFTLTAMLAVLGVRGLRRYVQTRNRAQLMWGGGIAFATAAMAVEGIVFLGFVSVPLLQAYVFFSAAIVGVLSLGATRVLRSPRIERAYSWYTAATCAVVGVFSFLTPLSTTMVSNGIIAGDPPLLLIILSTLVTAPATVILITASVVSLRRDRRWQTLLMIAGAVILGAGGTLYIASFPVALYYAEFLGIICLFLGLISLPQSTPAASPAAAHGTSS